MTFSEVSKILKTHFNTGWSAITPSPGVLFWVNDPRKPPISDPWIRASVFFHESQNAAIGTDYVRISGLFIVQAFQRYDTGEGAFLVIADHVKAIMENKTLAGTVFTYAASVHPVGDSVRQLNHIESDWHQNNINVRFETAQ